jgi:hypothetical protein
MRRHEHEFMNPRRREAGQASGSRPADPRAAGQQAVQPPTSRARRGTTGAALVVAAGANGLWTLAEPALGLRSVSWKAFKAAYFVSYFVYRSMRADARRRAAEGVSRVRVSPELAPGPEAEPSARPPSPTGRLRAEAEEGRDSAPRPQSPSKTNEDSASGRRTFVRLRRQMDSPATGAAITGAAVLGAATLLGFAEAAVGAAAAYGAYRVLAKRRRSAQAEAPPQGRRRRG